MHEHEGYNCCVIHSHLEYEVDGVTYMRMKFYVTGQRRKGEVHLDLKKAIKFCVPATKSLTGILYRSYVKLLVLKFCCTSASILLLPWPLGSS